MIFDFDDDALFGIGIMPGFFAWNGVSNPSASIDTPGTTEVGWAFSVPATVLHYEVPAIEMSFSTPSDLLQFDSPMT